jgi:hypothetical protein
MNPEKKVEGTPDGVATTVKMTGASGKEHEVSRELYDDLMSRFKGEKIGLQSKYEKQIEELTARTVETEKAFKELQKSIMTEKERSETEKAEREQAIIKAKREADENNQKYKNFRIKSEINRIVSKHSDKLISPEHTAIIIESIMKPDLKGEDVMCNNTDLESAFLEYIKKDDNKGLVKNNLNPGSGANAGSSSSAAGKSQQTYDVGAMKNMSPKEKLKYIEQFN